MRECLSHLIPVLALILRSLTMLFFLFPPFSPPISVLHLISYSLATSLHGCHLKWLQNLLDKYSLTRQLGASNLYY